MKLKLIEQRWTDKHRKQYIKLYKDLLEVRKSGAKDKVTETKEAVTKIKDKMSEICPVFFGGILTRGKKETYVLDFQDTPIKVKDFIPLITERHKDKRIRRKEYKNFRTESKKLLGFRYTMLGNSRVGYVFNEKNSILKLVGTQDDHEILRQAKAPMKYKQESYVGIEIECVVKCSKEYLADIMIETNLHRYVQLKDDSSIQKTQTHPYSVEITVCAPESTVKQVITNLCTVLRRRTIDARANNSCGLHVHLDMRLRDATKCYSNLFLGQELLMSMVPQTRTVDEQARRYCKKNTYATLTNQKAMNDRYHVINVESLSKYKTIEIRLHSGTTNAEKINNWIELLILLADSNIVGAVNTIQDLDKQVTVVDSLKAYIIKRVAKFKGKRIDTNEDELVA